MTREGRPGIPPLTERTMTVAAPEGFLTLPEQTTLRAVGGASSGRYESMLVGQKRSRARLPPERATSEPLQAFKSIPFKTVSAYIVTTMALAFFGPVQYPDFGVGRKLLVAGYIGFFLALTWLAMKHAASYTPRNQGHDSRDYVERVLRIVVFAIYFSAIMRVALLASAVQSEGLPRFTTLLRTLAAVYTDLHSGQETSTNPIRQLTTLTTFIFYIGVLGGLFNWKRLNRSARATLIICLVSNLVYSVFYIGTQASLLPLLVFCFLAYSVGVIHKRGNLGIRRVGLMVIASVALIFCLSSIVGARFQYWGSGHPGTQPGSGISYNLDNPVVMALPREMRYPTATILSYPAQGYYGLSLTLTQEFEWTYGLGASRSLRGMVAEFFPEVTDLAETTYPLRTEVETGYPGLANWHTIFPWLASDLTFLGALLYMAAAGWAFMRCWVQVIWYRNTVAFVLLNLLTMQYIYAPANNYLMTSRGDTVALIVLTFWWLRRGHSANEPPRITSAGADAH